MSDPLRRFQHLERPRVDRGERAGATDPAPAARFDGVEPPHPDPLPRSRGGEGAGLGGRGGEGAGEGARPARTGAQLDRFGPEPEPRIELAEAEGRQPFTRCMRCGMDSSVFATECPGCTASLDTPEQHAFNERLWVERQAEAAREAQVLAERRTVQERAASEDASLRRSAYEELAREVGDAERRRLGAPWGWPSRWWGDGRLAPDATPLAIRLLNALPDRRTQVAVGVVGVGVLLGLAAAGVVSMAHGGRGTALGAAIALAGLLLAPGWWRRF